MSEFKVNDIFFLGDGKVVFAGDFLSGSYKNGLYELCTDGISIAKVSIVGEVHFPSKATNDIAIYTFDNIRKEQVDLGKKVVLKFMEAGVR